MPQSVPNLQSTVYTLLYLQLPKMSMIHLSIYPIYCCHSFLSLTGLSCSCWNSSFIYQMKFHCWLELWVFKRLSRSRLLREFQGSPGAGVGVGIHCSESSWKREVCYEHGFWKGTNQVPLSHLVSYSTPYHFVTISSTLEPQSVLHFAPFELHHQRKSAVYAPCQNSSFIHWRSPDQALASFSSTLSLCPKQTYLKSSLKR